MQEGDRNWKPVIYPGPIVGCSGEIMNTTVWRAGTSDIERRFATCLPSAALLVRWFVVLEGKDGSWYAGTLTPHMMDASNQKIRALPFQPRLLHRKLSKRRWTVVSGLRPHVMASCGFLRDMWGTLVDGGQNKTCMHTYTKRRVGYGRARRQHSASRSVNDRYCDQPSTIPSILDSERRRTWRLYPR